MKRLIRKIFSETTQFHIPAPQFYIFKSDSYESSFLHVILMGISTDNTKLY